MGSKAGAVAAFLPLHAFYSPPTNSPLRDDNCAPPRKARSFVTRTLTTPPVQMPGTPRIHPSQAASARNLPGSNGQIQSRVFVYPNGWSEEPGHKIETGVGRSARDNEPSGVHGGESLKSGDIPRRTDSDSTSTR